MEKFYAAGNKLNYTLRPLRKIHLYSDLRAEFEPNGDITYVYLFIAIALFILVIASINFMNLSTARSANRAREVGVRKVLGSLRSHLIRQFLSESIIISFFSFLLAFGLAYMLLPTFNELTGKHLTMPWSNTGMMLFMIVSAIIIGIFAGLYPAFFLSAFRPANVLKGKLSRGTRGGSLRSALVIFQFFISIFLIIATIAVYSQLNFIQNKKLGFNKDQVIVIQDTYTLGKQANVFKNEVIKNNMIQNGTFSGFLPVTGTNRSDMSFWDQGKQPNDDNMKNMQTWVVDKDYIPTMGMDIVEGRNFSTDFPTDSSAVILNQSAVRNFGFEGNPIGKEIHAFSLTYDNSIDKNAIDTWHVIGVVKDFHFESLRDNITPLGFFLGSSNSLASFRFKAKDTKAVIDYIHGIWKKLAPDQPFDYSFLDEDFQKMYGAEQRLGKLFAIFSGLSILIACLGLFALTAYTAEQRTKEIGIRKVMGASVKSIVFLLSKDYGKLIIIAFAIAAPLGWYGIQWWLQNYTYRVHIGIIVYLIAGILAFLLAAFTMAYQSVKAANTNPVKTLRSE